MPKLKKNIECLDFFFRISVNVNWNQNETKTQIRSTLYHVLVTFVYNNSSKFKMQN